MFRPLISCSVGGVLYPWRYWTAVEGGITAIELIEFTAEIIEPGRFASLELSTPSGFS
jgi:hypothetical protein